MVGMNVSANELERMIAGGPNDVSEHVAPRGARLAMSACWAGLLLLFSLAFCAWFLTAVLVWQNDWKDINQALNDQYDIDPWIDFVVLILCLICVSFATLWFVFAWHLVKYVRLHRRDAIEDDDISACRRCCLGKAGSVALAFWVLMSLVLLILIIGTVGASIVPALFFITALRTRNTRTRSVPCNLRHVVRAVRALRVRVAAARAARVVAGDGGSVSCRVGCVSAICASRTPR